MRPISLIALLLTCLALIPSSPAQQTKPPAEEPATAAKPESDLVVVKLPGQLITEKDVLGMIMRIASQQQMSPEELKQQDVLLFRGALENLIGMALLKNEGKEKQLAVDQAKVDETYKEMAARFPSADEFAKALKDQSMTEAELRAKIADNLVYQETIDLVLKAAPAPTEDDIKKFYDDNPQYFEEPEQVHAAHILLMVQKDATAEQKAEIKKKLDGIRNDIENNKIKFEEAAAKFSEDKSNAASGGDLNFFARGQMVKPFEDAAFSTQPGNLSQVTETQFGFHLIKVIEMKPAGKVGLDATKDKIASFLDQKSKQETIGKHVEELRSKVKVEIMMTEDQWKARHSAK